MRICKHGKHLNGFLLQWYFITNGSFTIILIQHAKYIKEKLLWTFLYLMVYNQFFSNQEVFHWRNNLVDYFRFFLRHPFPVQLNANRKWAKLHFKGAKKGLLIVFTFLLLIFTRPKLLQFLDAKKSYN